MNSSTCCPLVADASASAICDMKPAPRNLHPLPRNLIPHRNPSPWMQIANKHCLPGWQTVRCTHAQTTSLPLSRSQVCHGQCLKPYSNPQPTKIMKTNQELNALRHRARANSRRMTQAVYILTLVTVTMIAVAFYTVTPQPLVVASCTALAGLILAYRSEKLENEYRDAVYASRNPNQNRK